MVSIFTIFLSLHLDLPWDQSDMFYSQMARFLIQKKNQSLTSYAVRRKESVQHDIKRASLGFFPVPALSHAHVCYCCIEFTIFQSQLVVSFSEPFAYLLPLPSYPHSLCASFKAHVKCLLTGTSLVVQWLRVHLAMKGMQVQSQVEELRAYIPWNN